jgi:hypothetical protein
MSFIFPILLGGLVLTGIPVVLHLIMRQKPKHLLFPAFRFLLQRHRSNQRKLQLRHLLLLALRLLLIIGICLALARPKVFSERLNLSTDRPVAAVFVFDTSYSMQYTVKKLSRLEEAKKRARELLDELPQGSRVAILDTAGPGGEWLSLSAGRDRVDELRLRPANSPVTSRLAEAYRLLADLELEVEGDQASLPRFLYIFSDRTQECWDPTRLKDLQQSRDRLAKEVHAAFIDVGIENPVDVGLLSVELSRQVIPRDEPAVLKVTVRAAGADCDTEIACRVDDEKTPERKPIKLAAGQSHVITFERRGLPPGSHQAEITLATTDELPFNNSLFATFEVGGGRRILTLVDRVSDRTIWDLALTSNGLQSEVRDMADARNLSPNDLSRYQAVCLLNVAKPDHDLWEKLERYVVAGGGLAVIPGGGEVDKPSYNDDQIAQRLLPGRLIKLVKAETKEGATWKAATYQHPVMVPFREWGMNQNVDFERYPPAAERYWEVQALASTEAYVIVSYVDKEKRPALLERNFDHKKIRGRVLLFTTPLDARHLAIEHPWNDYLKTSFYLVLVNKTVGYLAGDAEEASFNHLSGGTVFLDLTGKPRSSTYTLQGPGLSATESMVTRGEGEGQLALTQAVTPGNYTLLSGDGKRVASFSVNIPPAESQLTRVPSEQIDALLGDKAILPVGRSPASLHEALQGHWAQPVELFPWLMILLLLVLAVENLLANKFYRREPSDPDTNKATVESSSEALETGAA